jgi:hypothetical protein
MSALFWKEIRSLRAFLLAVFALLILGHAHTLLTEFPDSRPFTPTRIITDVSPTSTVTVMAILLGVGLLLREHRDGTLTFLDALPVSRSQVFLAKLAAGMLLLLAAASFELAIEGIFGWLSRTSVDGPVPVKFTAALLALLPVTSAYMLSLSLLLSFLRQWFALALGLGLWGALWLSAEGVAWIEVLNPFLLVPRLDGEAVHVPWKLLRVQAAVAVGALFVAWFLFQHLGMRAEDVARKYLGRRWKAVSTILIVAATPLVWVGALVAINRIMPSEGDGASAVRSDDFAEEQTQYYHFLFRESQRERAAPLIAEADAAFAPVAEIFDGVSFPGKVIVDLASPVPAHLEGATNWTRLRVPLWHDRPTQELLHTLAHETAHAFQHESGGTRYLEEFSSTRFFNEGVATHVALDLFGTEEEVASWNRQIAGVVSRGNVPFPKLSDNDVLRQARDPELVYPLGLAFCRGLVRIGGAQTVQKTMAAFRRLPTGVPWKGEQLWRHVFAEAGVDLDRVIAAYEEEVATQLQEHAAFVARLPVLSGAVSREGDEIIIRVSHKGAAPGPIVCCVEDPSLLGGENRWHHADAEGVIRFSREPFTAGTVRYMLGWSVEETAWPIFEPWAQAAIH